MGLTELIYYGIMEMSYSVNGSNYKEQNPMSYGQREKSRVNHRPIVPMLQILAEAEIEMSIEAARQELFRELRAEATDFDIYPSDDSIWDMVDDLMTQSESYLWCEDFFQDEYYYAF